MNTNENSDKIASILVIEDENEVRESYKDIGMVTVVIPLVATAVAIVFASFGVV